MRVYLKPQAGLSRAMNRVALALEEHLPEDSEVVQDVSAATHVVLHVIGFPETVEAVAKCRERGQKYIIIQYCLRTTQEPQTGPWLPLWEGAEFVWSYYDLPALCAEDGNPVKFSFYYAPIGVDPDVFRHHELLRRKWKCVTTGTLAYAESAVEVGQACEIADGPHLHIGRVADHKFGPKTVNLYELPDETVVMHYQSAQFVSGLRKVEGFELPAAEGLLCGARPILYDKPHYRKWYSEWAYFVPEGNADRLVACLTDLFTAGADPVTPEQRAAAARRFDWNVIAPGFWANATKLKAVPQVTVAEKRRKLLWVGDAIVASGFAQSTHQILPHLLPRWEVEVLGLNYHGDPYNREKHPYDVYPAAVSKTGDAFGVGRIAERVSEFRPDVVVIQNDPWNFPPYMKRVGNVPVVGIVAVDGLNCRGKLLNGLAGAIFWTEFGAKEAQKGGYSGKAFVAPLGVDLDIYKPMDRTEARKRAGLGKVPLDAFILGNVNRNQPRKRLDLTVAYFAEWVHTRRIADAYLYLHVCPTGDVGYDVSQLAEYYHVSNRLILAEPPVGPGIPEELVVVTYNCFDVQVSTSQGEGFGLTTLEAMACGIPQIAPRWSALEDWADEGAALIDCTSTVTTPVANAIGGVPDCAAYIDAMDQVYREPATRQKMSEAARRVALRDVYRWRNIAAQVEEAIEASLAPTVLSNTA